MTKTSRLSLLFSLLGLALVSCNSKPVVEEPARKPGSFEVAKAMQMVCQIDKQGAGQVLEVSCFDLNTKNFLTRGHIDTACSDLTPHLVSSRVGILGKRKMAGNRDYRVQFDVPTPQNIAKPLAEIRTADITELFRRQPKEAKDFEVRNAFGLGYASVNASREDGDLQRILYVTVSKDLRLDGAEGRCDITTGLPR